MNIRTVFFIFISALACLNLGTVRKAEDPIRDTQTNPILYEQKKEEEKGGKKGALLYNVKNNPRESFFIDPPFEKEKEKGSAVKESATGSAGTEGWWEEPATAPETSSPAETVSEPLPESPSGGEEVSDRGVKDQPVPAEDAEKDSSGQGSDYWW